LLSLANPSRGESLAWRPEAEPPAPLPAVKRVGPPEEWRLTGAAPARWSGGRSGGREERRAGPPLTGRGWRRLSENPWRWQQDAPRGVTRRELADSQPPQKSASEFRAGPLVAWPMPEMDTTTAGVAGLDTPLLPPPLPGAGDPSAISGQPFPSLQPPMALPQAEPSASTAIPPLVALEPEAHPERGVSSLRPSPDASRTPAAAAETSETIDWLSREITGPIPGAYLTIYPKLKFIGLCVPGQGYIRKYNQVGVPQDPDGGKMNARDGKTPYGRYYIADRHLDRDGPRLYLSWPSPEDARRIGLDSGRVAEVDNAWRRRALPPQNTVAGGGLGLNGLRNWVEFTEGGFTLEAPHMEEIFTALPEGAWVFIQP
ncbi:MAG: hypothetical protein LIP77_07655, partial [Planctomycetes bacterium]|nr:hypothetical protein [Planctomycetota bacterium]